MNARSTIRKIVFVSVWLCIAGGMVTLLVAAMANRNKGICQDYVITMGIENGAVFMQKTDVENLLKKLTGSNIRNREVASFNLYELERKLEENSWINDAELWFDNKDVLHVRVSEKQPIARVFTKEGESFYIDRTSRKIPLSANHTAKLPVFTGFPNGKKLSKKDSVILSHVTETASYIYDNPFWMAQVAQVDIAENGTMEMIPLVGTHIVKLGNGEDIAKKFHRLYQFYRQVLSRKGFSGYAVIDVQYKGQVVASKGETKGKVDAAQYRKHIEKLIKESHDEVVPLPGRYDLQADSVSNATPELDEIEKTIKPVQTVNKKTPDPNPLKSSSKQETEKKSEPVGKKEEPQPVKKEELKPKKEQPKTEKKTESNEKRQPRAVMPKRTETSEGDSGGDN